MGGSAGTEGLPWGGEAAPSAELKWGRAWGMRGPDGSQAGLWEAGFDAVPEFGSESKQGNGFVSWNAALTSPQEILRKRDLTWEGFSEVMNHPAPLQPFISSGSFSTLDEINGCKTS